jgi:acetolactate synthase-1/2/3 large subunit
MPDAEPAQTNQMDGAELLLRTLVAGGVDTCFGNPGTSEMSFVAALDRVPAMRGVLGLFEGVATGAADGYYRMTGRPAATLLHLGPGLSNGSANLHNARKAKSGIINVVGQHATAHLAYDSPLQADLDGLAAPVSDWVGTAAGPDDTSRVAAAAIAVASGRPGRIASVLLPGDAAWGASRAALASLAPAPPPLPAQAGEIAAARAALLSGEPTLLLVGGRALSARALAIAGKIAARTGCLLATRFSYPRIERGAGRVATFRIAYAVDQAVEELRRFRHMVCVQSPEPVGFFGYPDKPSLLKPPGCEVHQVCSDAQDELAVLTELAEAVGAGATPPLLQPLQEAQIPTGALTPDSIAVALSQALPEGAIVVDESLTTGRRSYGLSAGARPHDWIQNMGGSIGFGTPVALGAALACPDRRVVCIVGDGSFMMTLQSLWSHAREQLDITTVVFANRSYNILKGEFANVGAGTPGPRALEMLDIDRPTLDFVQLAGGMGIPGKRVQTADDLYRALSSSFATRGPSLIEAVL